mgnify:CR=1 FL=1
MTRLPEFALIVFSFLLHFVWEFWQAPTYAGMIELNHWDGIKLCSSATFGDVGFALTAFWITSAGAQGVADDLVPRGRDRADGRV